MKNYTTGIKGISKKRLLIIVILLAGFTTMVKAQNSDDVLRYSLEYPTYDPVSLVIPGASQATGFGAYQENPAVMALFRNSFMSFDLSNVYTDESGEYLGNSIDFSNNQIGIGDLGFLHSVPVERGSLVIGGGYSQTTDFNRALSASGRNNQSSITDHYSTLPRDHYLNTLAFNTYTIEDVGADSSVSIFRLGSDFSAYPGINQEMELTEGGQMGEYSAFLATEFQKNFMFGASVGLYTGDYSYRRAFLEVDRQNDYDGAFIDADGDGEFETDIDNILVRDNIDANIRAFSARLGLLYKAGSNLNLGISYHYTGRLYIDETYNTEITTTFDNGEFASDDAPGEFSYKIERPDRIKAGFSLVDWNKLNLSVSAEGVLYSQGRIDFDELDLNSDEREINNEVKSNFNDVVNFRAGLEYLVNRQFTPRIGYGYYQSPRKGFDAVRQFISGGFSAEITYGLTFNLGVQYGFWDDANSIYFYDDGAAIQNEIVQEEVAHWNVMGGVELQLY